MFLKTALTITCLTVAATACAAKASQMQTNSSPGGIPAPIDKAEDKNKSRPTQKQLPKRYKLWIRIGRCEQPGSQRPGRINWSHPGPRYGGGLGIYIGTWQAFRVKGMPMSPGAASWRQQMWVANRIFNRYGGSHPWGCG